MRKSGGWQDTSSMIIAPTTFSASCFNHHNFCHVKDVSVPAMGISDKSNSDQRHSGTKPNVTDYGTKSSIE